MPFTVWHESRAEFLYLVGNAWIMSDEWEKAWPFHHQAVLLMPNSASFSVSLFLVLSTLNRMEEAFDEVERLLRLNDSNIYDEPIIGYAGAVGYKFEKDEVKARRFSLMSRMTSETAPRSFGLS